jgi:hypothetical protein
VSFVDDDDLVEEDFVSVVLGAMESEPDYVAFRHQLYKAGVPETKPTLIGLTYGGWYITDEAYVCDVTHVNPARTELARKAGFRRIAIGEDRAYVDLLRPLLKTEVVIDRVLYHYYCDPSHSSVQVMGGMPRALLYREVPVPQVRSPVFRWHEESVFR